MKPIDNSFIKNCKPPKHQPRRSAQKLKLAIQELLEHLQYRAATERVNYPKGSEAFQFNEGRLYGYKDVMVLIQKF